MSGPAEPFEYFQKYASLLDEGELLELFDIVKAEAGSLSAAAGRCGIERKTIYDVMKEGKQVTRRTKSRILAAAASTNLEKAMGTLLSKVTGDSREILLTYLSLAYETVMQASDSNTFQRANSKLDLLLGRYSGLILDGLQEEVGSIVREVMKRGEDLGVPYVPKHRAIDDSALASLIPGLVRDLIAGGTEPVTIAKKWRVDPAAVLAASQSIRQYQFNFSAFGIAEIGMSEQLVPKPTPAVSEPTLEPLSPGA